MPDESLIPFDEFMRHALYAPDTGYYSRRVTGLGPRGDFTTIPLRSDALARRIATWIRTGLMETGCRDIIEIGPGTGQLAHAVRQYLPWHVRLRTRFHLVEISPPLRALQQERMGKSACWHDSPQEALAACHGKALIYSNELVDAFPVRRFQHTAAGWREIGVRICKGTPPLETHLPTSALPESSSLSFHHPPGQIVEVHESYRIWLQSWLPLWRAGRMLTIDYGSTADRLYHRQPRGTLRAYLLHERITGEGIYGNIGRQDLTADVNFTDLMHWSKPWMDRQHMMRLGELCGNHAPAWLKEESGPGDAFLVLDEQRIPQP